MASGPITSWQIDGETGETVETVADFILGEDPKSLQMVITPGTAAHRAPCPSPTPRACSHSSPLSQ